MQGFKANSRTEENKGAFDMYVKSAFAFVMALTFRRLTVIIV